MDSDYNVGFYNQYNLLVVELDHAMQVEIFGTYLICSDANNSIKFFVNTITLISGPTFSQAYTPLNVGFYQQDSAYFSRLNEIKAYIQANVVKVLFRDINALIFSDGSVQTTAATGGGGSGTVTSVGFTAGTGITVGGTNPITTSGTVTITNSAPDQIVSLSEGAAIDVTGSYPNFTIANTAPDQTVVLNNGTGISTSGTYPNFTITNTSPDQTVSIGEGTGIDVTGTYPSFTVTNTAPDQTVVLTEGTGIDITGTYPNFTIASTVTGGIQHGTATGTDTYAVTISGVTSYADGDAYLIRFTNGNTTTATLNINSLGAVDLYRNNDGVLIGGDIQSGAEMICVYNSTLSRFQVIGTSPNSLIAYVTNVDSVSITKGQPVYAFGGQGDRLTVKRAYNTGDSTSAQTIGLVLSSSIGVNQKGLIMMQGLLDGLNILPTSTWADGDPVYLGATAGSITKTKQYAPNHLVYLGFVTTANNGSAGRMYVKVQNGYELDELHNVQAQSPSLKDTLYYDNTVSPAQWKTASIPTILGYTPGSGTVTSVATTSPILGGTITGSGTISIQQADTSKAGYISSTDWNTFNNKQAQLNGTGFVKASGTTISYDNSTYYLASNPSGYTSNTGTVTSVSGTGTTAGLSLSGSVSTSGSLTLSGTLSTPVSTINDSTTVGQNLVKLTNPSAVTFLRVNADNTVSTLDATTFRTAIGAGTSSTNGTVTSVAALTLGTSGTDLGSSVATGTTTPVITLNVPTASATNRGALSSTDWSTFNNKQDTITGAATTVTTSNLTANRAVISNGSGKIAVSAATDTEVGYLSGVTSAIQTQLNAKQGTLTLTTTGTSGAASLVGSTLNVPQYASSGSGTSFLTGSYALSTVGASTTTYSTLTGGSMNTTENYRLTLIPQTCTISRMYFSTLTTQSATGSLVVTLRKNNADTALTLTVAAGSVAGTFSDTTNSVSFTAGQNASVKLQNNATATSCQTNCISFLVTI